MNKSLITEIGGETKQEFSARYVRVLRTLSACSRVVIRATDEQTLLDEICRTMVTAGGYTHSWVGVCACRQNRASEFVNACGIGCGCQQDGKALMPMFTHHKKTAHTALFFYV